MNYAITLPSGVTEIRQDSYKLPKGAIELTDEQHEKLCSGEFILQGSEIVANPNPPKRLLGGQA